MRYTITCLALLIITTSRLSAQAQDTATSIGTVVVTATKSPVEKAALSQPVTTISGDDLRARGVARVSDALRSVPGAAVVQNGSTGSVNTMFLRGGESRYTKVLIDGVTVNAPGGFFDFSHLTTDNIDRIEIVRGPAAVVHGADAMTGVVQIFTRQGGGPASLSASARAGTYGTREVAVEGNGATAWSRYSLGGSTRRTDGIFDFNNQYYNGTLSGSLGVVPAPGNDILVSARYGAAEYHYPTDYTGAPIDSSAYRVQHRLTVGLASTSRLNDAVTARVRLGTNEVSDLTELMSLDFGSGDIVKLSQLARNKRRNVEAGLSFALARSARIDAGVEYVHESERSADEKTPPGGTASPLSSFDADRSTRAAYAEVIGEVARASVTAAARIDDNSEYDAHATYRVGASVPISSSSRVRASLGTAFNAPAFNQIRPTLYTVGSPGLKPERALSWEIGAEQALAGRRILVAGTLFRQRFKDMIQYVSGGPPNFLGSFENLTEAESNGVEGELTLRPSSEWSLSASYTVAEPRVTRVAEDYEGDLRPGDALIRRPTHSGSATLAWLPKTSASLSATAMYVGKRPDLDFTQFPSPTVPLPSYVRVDIAGGADVVMLARGKSAVGVTARIENLFDKEYEDVLNFRTPGRTILVGARFSGSL
jgi:vitamin B12 transporter